MFKLIVIAVLLLAATAGGQTEVLELEPREGTGAAGNIVFLSRGPHERVEPEPSDVPTDECSSKAYRVALSVDEVFFCVWIEELSIKGIECMDITIGNTYILGEELGAGEGMVEFVKWESWNTFVVARYHAYMRIVALGDGRFEMTTTPRSKEDR